MTFSLIVVLRDKYRYMCVFLGVVTLLQNAEPSLHRIMALPWLGQVSGGRTH